MIGRRQERSGFALLLVLMLVATAAILGVSYVVANATRGASATNLVSATRARYLAECGLEHSLYLLQNDPAVIANSSSASPLGPFYVGDTDDSYTFYAAPGAGVGQLYTLIATGTSKGVSQTSSLTVLAENRYANQVLALGPVGYWRLGETSGLAAADLTGAHPGTYVNDVSLDQPGALIDSSNPAARFDGVNDYVDTGNWSVAGEALTLLAWLQGEEHLLSESDMIAKTKGDDEKKCDWILGTVESEGQIKLQFQLQTQGASYEVAVSGLDDLRGKPWTFAAAVYDGQYMILYEDGVEVARTPQTGNLKAEVSSSVWIGSSPTDPTVHAWQGLLDEVAVLGQALSAEDIANLYAARRPQVLLVRWND